MPNLSLADLSAEIDANARRALAEDVGSGDITAQLIPAERLAHASVITREAAVISGTAWVDAVFRQVDSRVAVHWQVADGDRVEADKVLFHLEGPARALLTGERSALNFLQMLSGVATRCRHYADMVEGTGVRLLDTRKTIPGLRLAQKYAVTCGGCHNHRIGLYDAFLIKENHIAACGGIAECAQLFVRAAEDDAVAGEDHGPLRGVDQRGERGDRRARAGAGGRGGYRHARRTDARRHAHGRGDHGGPGQARSIRWNQRRHATQRCANRRGLHFDRGADQACTGGGPVDALASVGEGRLAQCLRQAMDQ